MKHVFLLLALTFVLVAQVFADDHRPGVERWAPRPEIGRPIAGALVGSVQGVYDGLGAINMFIVDAERSVGLIPPAPPRK